MSVGEFIAALALVATVFSASQAWWILPENEKQEQRLQKIESTAADRAETLARIDERTKRIEAALTPTASR
jgi:Flp pilus assembly protein TadB